MQEAGVQAWLPSAVAQLRRALEQHQSKLKQHAIGHQQAAASVQVTLACGQPQSSMLVSWT